MIAQGREKTEAPGGLCPQEEPNIGGFGLLGSNRQARLAGEEGVWDPHRETRFSQWHLLYGPMSRKYLCLSCSGESDLYIQMIEIPEFLFSGHRMCTSSRSLRLGSEKGLSEIRHVTFSHRAGSVLVRYEGPPGCGPNNVRIMVHESLIYI